MSVSLDLMIKYNTLTQINNIRKLISAVTIDDDGTINNEETKKEIAYLVCVNKINITGAQDLIMDWLKLFYCSHLDNAVKPQFIGMMLESIEKLLTIGLVLEILSCEHQIRLRCNIKLETGQNQRVFHSSL